MALKINFKERNSQLLIMIHLNSSKGGRGLYETGIQINPDSWDEEKQRCDSPDINIWIIQTVETLQKNFRPDMNAKRLWSSFINNQSETTATIKDAFEYYLANMPLKENSVSVYKSVINSLQHAGIYETPLTEVTPALLRMFMNSLKIQDSSKFNTFVRIKGCITRYIRDHRLNIAIDFDGICKKPKYVPKEHEWLTLTEVEKLWNADLKWAVRDARDLFVLCCYSGMSMSDVLKFTPSKHCKEINRREFIVFKRTKTGSECCVPITKQASDIINSREDWPIKIQKRAYQYHISNKLSDIIGRPIHSHMGRKTAGALFLQFGFSMETTAKFLGHSVMIFSKIYSNISAQKIDNEIERVSKSRLAVFG